MSELQDRAMLAQLTISQWTNRRHDKKVSSEVASSKGASKDAGRYHKQLVDKATLEPINKVATAARAYHYDKTLPWGDNGDRLLPASLFMDYTQQMRKFKDEFAQRVRSFVRDYPTLVQDARKRLGSMYDPMDYPPNIDHKFAIETSFTPVPAASDFRVSLNEEYVGAIKTEIEQRTMDRQAKAMQDLYGRVRDVVSHIHERLSDESAVFRDTLIDNARSLIEVLPHLNITGDPLLGQVEIELRELLVNPNTLRADTGKRSDIAAKAAAILSRFPKVE